jgi:serine/threonine-protein kinase
VDDDRDLILADRYRLVRPLGHGGMGEVWEARDTSLRRGVAVKVISVLAGGGSRAGEARARFLREARITAALQHPHIVTVHDLGEADTGQGTTPFLVMELLRGEGLDAVVRRGPVGGAEAARYGVQVCEALAEAHGAGVLHRDIKPANLFVTASGGLKVLDFGIARAADASATGDRLTQTGFMVGTAAYMAPEQARGRPEPRSDLYAVGCVLYELLTGRLPFDAPDTLGYVTAHLHEPPPLPGASPAWDALIGRLLAKDPGERPASAEALAEELREIGAGGTGGGDSAGRPVPPPGPGYTPTALSDDPAAADTVTAPAPPPAPLSRRSLLMGGAGIVAALAGGGAGVAYLAGGPERDPVVWSRKIAKVDLSGLSTPNVVVADGRVHVASGQYYKETAALHTFDLATGKPLWEKSLGQPWPQKLGFVVVAGTLLARTERAGDKGGQIDAFDTATGKRLWSDFHDAGYDVDLDVERSGGLLVSGREGKLTATDPRTGKEVWSRDDLLEFSGDIGWTAAGDLLLCSEGSALRTRTGKKAWSRPASLARGGTAHAVDGSVLCYEKGKTVAADLVCRSADTGAVRWRSPCYRTEPAYDGPVTDYLPVGDLVSGSRVLLPLPAGSRRKPTAVDIRTGKVAWTYDGAYDDADLRRGWTTRVAGGFVLPTGAGRVCLDARDGAERWTAPEQRMGASADGRYVLVSDFGQQRVFQEWTSLRIIDAARGRTRWEGELDARSTNDPAVGGGRAVVLDSGGVLWCVRV